MKKTKTTRKTKNQIISPSQNVSYIELFGGIFPIIGYSRSHQNISSKSRTIHEDQKGTTILPFQQCYEDRLLVLVLLEPQGVLQVVVVQLKLNQLCDGCEIAVTGLNKLCQFIKSQENFEKENSRRRILAIQGSLGNLSH